MFPWNLGLTGSPEFAAVPMELSPRGLIRTMTAELRGLPLSRHELMHFVASVPLLEMIDATDLYDKASSDAGGWAIHDE